MALFIYLVRTESPITIDATHMRDHGFALNFASYPVPVLAWNIQPTSANELGAKALCLEIPHNTSIS